MMVRHAEQRAREAAANADRYLRETFPRANATTLALALKEFNNDVALAKDALKEFFEEEDGGGGRGRRRGRGRGGEEDARRDGKRRRRDKKEKREKDRKHKRKHRRRSRSRSRSRARSRSRSRSRERRRERRRDEEAAPRRAFGNDEEERRAELAEARKKDEEARQKEIVARLRAHGDVSVMREQEILRQKLQIAHRVGDASEAERIKALLSVDDALAKAAKSNYGFRPGD